ncbi:MAG: EAL domain-containing protein [Sterolibacterium sp.]|nr:EAL domain-containing protein [Sterolibacterium sp.]
MSQQTSDTPKVAAQLDTPVEARVKRLSRYYALLSAIDREIIHPSSRDELFARVCRIAVDVGAFKMAWIGQVSADGRSFIPEVDAEGADYLASISITLEGDVTALGPTGRAVRTGRIDICNDNQTDPRMSPWRDKQLAAGYRASVSIPLLEDGRVVAALTLYAGQPEFFDAEEKRLLEAIGDDISHALDVIAQREALNERNIALEKLAAENALAAVVFRSSGEGIVITDAARNILAVNPCFSGVTGYSAAEVRGRNPRLLQSGAHDTIFYQSMWASIEATGSWKGEITNRNKEGLLYPEWLSISAVHDANGAITHYVGIFSDLPARKEMQQRLQHLTHYDALTDLPNRSLFVDRLEQALLTAQRFKRSLALLWIDLVRFHALNDAHGHNAGDAVLRETAHRLGQLGRKGDTLARLSADEFGLVLANLSQESDIIDLARKVIDTLAIPVSFQGKEISVAANIGISIFPKDAGSAEALLKAADTALERAKQAGRDNFRFFAAGMDVDAERRLRLEADLHHALDHGELSLHYQPQIDMTTGHLCGVEALLRWSHPAMGPISPVEFIPLAEEIGLIHAIGAWVLKEACRQNKAWQDAGHTPLPVAVNLSVKQFHQPGLVDLIAEALRDSGLAPALLELELTESAFIGDVHEAAEIVKNIRALGVQLALDDFGTGYSSLSYLSGFPFDKIKIDQSFVHDITTNPVNAAIATATIAMARSLDLVVLAEGVETDAQMRFLRSRQCEAMQGHLFSKALPAAELTELLGSGRTLEVDAGGTPRETLLLVDDEPNILSALKRLLHRDGYAILTAESPAAAFDLLAVHNVQVIVSDQRMPEMNGTEFLEKVKKLYPETIRIVLSGYTDLETVTDAINRGAIYRFLTKPWDDEMLRNQIREAFRVAHGLARL